MKTVSLALAAILATAATPALAGIAIFKASINAAQEVPTNISQGTGTATLTFDTVANTLTVSLDVENLLPFLVDGVTPSGLADGHIHAPAAPGVNSSVAIGFPGLPLGQLSFSYDTVINLANPASYRAGILALGGGTALGARDALIGFLSDGNGYVNIHSRRFPGGEIRGNIVVPAPAALALFGLGVATLALARRRAA